MPSESQLLYFHLCLRADDDGIVEAYPITKLLGTQPDVFRVLIGRDFIKQLNEDQVVVVTDWLEHNVIRPDRKVDSIYKHLLPESIETIEAKPRSDVEDNSKRLGGQSTDGIGKVSLGKDNISAKAEIFEEEPAPEMSLHDFPLPTGWYDDSLVDSEGNVDEFVMNDKGKRVPPREINALKKAHKAHTRIEKPKMISPSINDLNVILEAYTAKCKSIIGVSPIYTSKDKIVLLQAIKKYGAKSLLKVGYWYLNSPAKDKDKMNIKNIVWSKTLNDYQSETGIQL